MNAIDLMLLGVQPLGAEDWYHAITDKEHWAARSLHAWRRQ